MLNEFKKFLFRGNVIDLAVGIVIGTAFGTVVTAMVSDILTPLIAAFFKAPNFASLSFTINHSRFLYGNFLNAVISFLLVSAAIFFFVVKPINMLVSRSRRGEPEEPPVKKCKECLSEIPVEARRCAHCGQLA